MFQDLLKETSKVNEMKDEPIVSITKVIDDDTGIWANDEFEFQLHPLYDDYKKDKESSKRLANELRKVADMIEREGNENKEIEK